MNSLTWLQAAGVFLALPFIASCGSPMIRAAKTGQVQTLREYLPLSGRECTAGLLAAAENGHANAVKALLDSGCDVNSKDYNNYTSLMMAASGGHNQTVILLLEHKADSNLRTWNGQTAAMLARSNHHKATAFLIENYENAAYPGMRAMLDAADKSGGGEGPLDSALDAAFSGAAQNVLQKSLSGGSQDLSKTLAQGALQGVLNPNGGAATGDLRDAAVQGTPLTLRAAGIGAAQGAVVGLLSSPSGKPSDLMKSAAKGALQGAMNPGGDAASGGPLSAATQGALQATLSGRRKDALRAAAQGAVTSLMSSPGGTGETGSASPPETESASTPGGGTLVESQSGNAETQEPSTTDEHLVNAQRMIDSRDYGAAASELASVASILDADYPKIIRYHDLLGTIALRQNRLQDAKQAFRKSLDVSQALAVSGPTVSYAYLGMGLCLEAEGNNSYAKKFLKKALDFDPPPEVRRRIETKLKALGAEKNSLRQIEMPTGHADGSHGAGATPLHDENADIRQTKRVLESVNDADPTVRWEAVKLLAQLNAPETDTILVRMLRGDTDAGIRKNALDLLVDRNGAKATPLLLEALRDDDADIRLAALQGINKLGDYSTAAAVSESFKDPDQRVRLLALTTLNNLQEKKDQDVRSGRKLSRRRP